MIKSFFGCDCIMTGKGAIGKSNEISFCVLVFLFLVGVAAGCSAKLFFEHHNHDAYWFSTPPQSSNASTLYSSFLFDEIIYLAAVFLFGLTFIGIVVIPFVVTLRGFIIGVLFSCFNVTGINSEYIVNCFRWLPSVMCCAALMLFSAYAVHVSSRLCIFLKHREACSVSLKNYSLVFLFTFAVFAVLTAIYCGVDRLLIKIF